MPEGRIVLRRPAMRIVVIATLLAMAAAIVIILATTADDDPAQLPEAQLAIKQRPTPTPTLTTATPTMSEDEAAAAAAEQLPQRYFDVQADVRSEPESVLDKLDAYRRVADGTLLEEATEDAENMPFTGFVQDGAVTVVSTEVLEVDLENTRGLEPEAQSVQVHVCWDRTTAEYERNGEPWEPADEILSSEWDIRNYEYPDPEGWKAWDVEESDRRC